ncbi:MAG: peptidase M23, partial [Rhodanobacter sp.]
MAEENKGALRARKQAICRKAQRRHSRFYERCAHWSFNRLAEVEPIQWHREHWMLAGTALLITLLSGFIMPAWANAMKPDPVPAAHIVLPLTLPALPPVPANTEPVMANWHSIRVEAGQTLSDIFQAQGLSLATLQQVLDASGKDDDALRRIHPGDEFAFQTDTQGNLLGMRFDRDDLHQVQLSFDGSKISKTVVARTTQQQQQIGHGVITSSLFGAANKAGMSDGMAIKLADVFKYDIDFIKDIRRGDSFTVIYNDVYRDGAYLHSGDIIAAQFYNGGHPYTAFRFKKPDGTYGYYDASGRTLQKALLRVPLKFTRISSRFGMRMDPVIHERHLHAGVDYAAPMGTPIHAAGNGVITAHHWVRGYGRYVRIKNTPSYSTYYGHMSRYAPGLHVGSHVAQGQVIGYVGESGWATGPHLHYGVLLHGKPVNPLTVTLPKPQPLA